MVLTFGKKSFSNTILGFTRYWDYKDFGNGYFSEKNRNLTVIDEIHLKCDVIDESVFNVVGQTILCSFILDKKPGFNFFCNAETGEYQKVNKDVLKTISFHLQVDNHKAVDFNGETLTFAL